MGSLSLWIFPFPGFRDCTLPPDRIRFAVCGVDPVSARIFAWRLLAPSAHHRHTSCPSGPARRALVYFVSTNQYRLAVSISSNSFGELRLFRLTLPGQHRSACKFNGHRFPRPVSRQQNSSSWPDVLAWGGHVAVRWHGMAGAIRGDVDLSFNEAISQRQCNQTADYSRAA